jgi:DNA polymerase-3 subunit delta'
MSDISDRYHALNAEVFPWFTDQWQRILQLHNSERLPHAILLNGMKGIGKARLAEAVAGLVMCHQPKDGQACGHCRSCELLHTSGHPDLYYLSPEDVGKQIKVDQVRELTEFMHNTAQQGGYRVVIMDPAEAMNISAANALLKTLEEPGESTLLVLITHQLGQVLPTIKSRCQRLDCPTPSVDMAVPWLSERLEIDHSEATQLLKVVHGAPIAGLTFKSDGQQSLRSDWLTALRELLQQKKTVVEVSEQFAKLDIELILEWLIGVIADVNRYLLSQDSTRIRNNDVEKMIKGVAKNTSADKLFKMMDVAQEELLGLKRRHNPNKPLLLERILLQWVGLVRP